MEWRPIETAPKGPEDTILVLEFTHIEDYHTSISIGFWSTIDAFADDPREGWCAWESDLTSSGDYWRELHPTHWMPLPAPPSTTSEE